MSTSDLAAKKQAFWKEHFSSWEKSGLSQRSYCKQEGLSYRGFTYHYHRRANSSSEIPLNFIKIKPEASLEKSHPAATLQLILPNGVRVGVTGEISRELLQNLFTIAGGLRCCD